MNRRIIKAVTGFLCAFLAPAFGQVAPSISSFSPTQRTSGTPSSFTLTLNGSNFCADAFGGSVINFNGVDHAATTPDATTSSTLISNTELPASGTVPIYLTPVRGNCPLVSSNTVSLTINPALTLNPSFLPNAVVGSPYNQTLTAGGGTPAYSAPVPSQGAPPSTNSPGSVNFSFTPANSGSFGFNVGVTDAGGGQISPTYFLFVTQPSGVNPTQGTPQSATVNTTFATAMQVFVYSGPPTDPSPVAGAQVTFSAPGSGASGTFSGSAVVTTDGTGHATAPAFKANTTVGSYNVTASTAGVSGTFNLTNTVGPPSAITSTAGTPQSAAVNTAYATALQATVRDSFGNPVPGVSVTFTEPKSGPSGIFAALATVPTNANGVATAPAFATNTIAGGFVVTATVSGVNTPANFSLTNTAGPPATISSTAGTPQSATVNTAFSTALQATVRDANANPVSGVPVTFSAPGSGASGTFSGSPTVTTNASGVATAPTFTANSTAGSYSVTASTSGVATPATFSLTNNAGAPATISSTGGTPQSAAINTAFSTALQATVRDAASNPISGASVTFSAPGSGASGTFTGSATVTTNASGVATAPTFTANSTAGGYSVTASTSGVGAPATFSLTNTAGPPATITSTGGTPQSTPVLAPFAAPLQATVKDSGGNPVSGATVIFSVPNSGASATFGGASSVLTNASGVATSSGLKANGLAGSYSAAATVAGVGTPAIFSLTNTGGPSITTTSLPAGAVGEPYNSGVSADGGSPGYTFAITSGSLPPGLTFAPSGAITGTPTALGLFPILVQVTDSLGVTGAKDLSIRVAAALTITTSSNLPNAFLGTNYSLSFQATGGQPAYTWSIVGGGAAAASDKGRSAAAGGLPPGVTFNNGILSGAPTALGDYSFGVQVSDQANHSASKTFTLTSAPSSSAPAIQVSVADLDFEGPAGGNPPAPQYLAVVAANQQPLGAIIEIDGGGPGSAAPPWLGARFVSATTPARLAITTTQTGLPAGDYRGRVLVRYQGLQTLIVNVAFKINLTPPKLSVSPGYLRFAAITGVDSSLEQALLVSNLGTGGGIDFTSSVTEGGAWLSLTPGSGKTVVGGGVPLRVLVNAQGLKIGSYLGKIHVQSATGGSVDVPVSLFISPNGPIISVSPLGVRFDSREGNGLANPREITILNTGTGLANWKAELQAGGQGWLTLSPAAGQSTPNAPGKLALSAAPAALNAGPYYALIRISDPQALNSPQVALAVLNVRAATTTPEADIAPSGLYFIAVAGSAPPAAQNLKVYVSSETAAAFQSAASADDGGDWLSVDKTNGAASTQAPGQIAVSVNPAKLKPGVYTGDVSVSFSTPGIRTANITLVVLPQGASLAGDEKLRSATAGCTPAKLALTSTSLANAFSSPAGWPTPLLVQVNDDCGNPAANARVVATFSNGDPPLSLSMTNPSVAQFSGTWAPSGSSSQMTVKLTGLAQGLSTATLNLLGTVGSNPAPTLDNNGAVNNLNPGSAGGALAPGTVTQVYGGKLSPASGEAGVIPLPKAVNDTQVLIGLQSAPLYYVSDRQINLQIPAELQPDRQYSILVSSGAAFTLPDTITITSVSPGLLAFAQHADFSTVTPSSPVRPSEVIRLYLVGMGATDQNVASGAASPSTPLARANVQPTVTVGGKPVEVSFAGLSPGLVGLYQIDLTLPSDLPSGDATVTVTQGDTVSNTVTIPVR